MPVYQQHPQPTLDIELVINSIRIDVFVYIITGHARDKSSQVDDILSMLTPKYFVLSYFTFQYKEGKREEQCHHYYSLRGD